MVERRDSDEGITLVELLVYMLLAVVVLTVVSTILINSLRAESIVRESAAATSSGQLAAQSLSRGVHNAGALQVSSPAGMTLLRSRSLDSSEEGAWRCQAWVVADGQLRTTTSATAIADPTTPASLSSWLLLTDGVRLVGSTPVFSLSGDGRSLAVSFRVENGTAVPFSLDTTVVSKQPVPSTGRVTEPCF